MRRAVPIGLAIIGILLALGGDAVAQPRAAIHLQSPRAYQVFQRDAHDRGVLVVSGRCRGFTGRLRVGWGRSRAVIVRAAPDGRFAVRFRVSAGQAPLTVSSLSSAAPPVTREFVGVGDVYVIAGQSNASGRSPQMSEAYHPKLRAAMFGNDYRWGRLLDPLDDMTNQVDRVSADRKAAGSVWPLVATELMRAENVPVAFIPCARGSLQLWRWLPDPTRAPRRTLFGSMLRRIRAAGGARAVLLWEGEADARYGTPKRTFTRQLRSFGTSVWKASRSPVVVAQIGDFNPVQYPADNIDVIRAAASEACAQSAVLLPGPALYDVDLDAACHVMAPDDKVMVAHRWTAAILRGVLGRDVPASPSLAGATRSGEQTIDLRFDGAALAAGPAGGFTVRSGGEPATVTSAEVTGNATVRLVLAAAPEGPLTISLGEGRAGAGAPVPVEGSLWRLPAPAALRLPVTDPPALMSAPSLAPR